MKNKIENCSHLKVTFINIPDNAQKIWGCIDTKFSCDIKHPELCKTNINCYLKYNNLIKGR